MCTLVNKLYGAGFEVADFTDSGATLAGLDQLTMRDRIATARTKLAQCVGIREDSIVGFRWVARRLRVGLPRSPNMSVGMCVRELVIAAC